MKGEEEKNKKEGRMRREERLALLDLKKRLERKRKRRGLREKLETKRGKWRILA